MFLETPAKHMRLARISFICFLLIGTSCHNPHIASGIPKCIYKEINQKTKSGEWIVGSVKEYEFQGKLVYAFEPDISKINDGATTVKDADCNSLCDVGGFAGQRNNQCNGGNFFKEAVYKRTIWEKK